MCTGIGDKESEKPECRKCN